jgi:hypothetical protein
MALSLPSFLMENANGAIPYSAVSFQARNGETNFVTCHNTEHCSHPWTHFHKHAEVSGEFLQHGFPLSQEIQ